MVGAAQGAGGIAVALFVLDITAAVILISPALVIGLIVHPDKLPYWVIDIADGLPLVDNGGDIAVVIVGIAQVVPALRDAADQRRGAVCPIASCRVAVAAEVGGVVEHSVSAGDPAQGIVHIVCAVDGAVVAQEGRPVFVIVDEVGGILGALVAQLLLKAADVVVGRLTAL